MILTSSSLFFLCLSYNHLISIMMDRNWLCLFSMICVRLSWNTYFFLCEDWRILISSKSLYFWPFTRKDVSAVSNYYSEDFVTQHDVLRDLAIHLSSQEPITESERLIVDISGNNLPEWWTEQEQQHIDLNWLVHFLNWWRNNLPKWWMKQKQQRINARLLSISTG